MDYYKYYMNHLKIIYFLFFFKTNQCKKVIMSVTATGTYLSFILLVVSHLNALRKYMYFELLPKCQTVTSDHRADLFNPVMIVILR